MQQRYPNLQYSRLCPISRSLFVKLNILMLSYKRACAALDVTRKPCNMLRWYTVCAYLLQIKRYTDIFACQIYSSRRQNRQICGGIHTKLASMLLKKTNMEVSRFFSPYFVAQTKSFPAQVSHFYGQQQDSQLGVTSAVYLPPQITKLYCWMRYN